MLRLIVSAIVAAWVLASTPCFANEELVTTAHTKNGEAVPYVFNYNQLPPKYVVILFPGGPGIVDPHLEEGTLVYQAKKNFLLRSRPFILDDEFATVATNATSSEERMQALIDDLSQRFPGTKIYLMGTSRGTYATVSLAGYLSERIAGVIHTSSMNVISGLDASKYKNRQLIVHHRNDACKHTPFTSAQAAHEKHGTELIAIEGGVSVGDPCQPFAYHGYYGIEKETIARIKAWIKQGK